MYTFYSILFYSILFYSILFRMTHQHRLLLSLSLPPPHLRTANLHTEKSNIFTKLNFTNIFVLCHIFYQSKSRATKVAT